MPSTEPLTVEHGIPLRLVVPHLYGCKSPSGRAELGQP
ncbi:molybdopterin-dependent oxidoreductase [Streptomyces sp. NPDC002215]